MIIHKETVKPISLSHAPPPPEKRNKQANTLFGIYAISDSEEASCQEQPGEVRIVTSIWDSVVHFTVGPLYTTKTVEVYCPLFKKSDLTEKNQEPKTAPKENPETKEPPPKTSSLKPESPPEKNNPEKDTKDKSKSKKKHGEYIFDSQF